MKPFLLLCSALLMCACGSSAPPPAERPEPEPSPAAEPPVAPASNAKVKQGRDALEAQDFETAKTLLADARKADPNDPQAAYYLGVALGALGDGAGATGEYRAALALDPKLAEASVNLSQILLDGGDAAGALAVVDAGLTHAPKQPDLLLNRAVALEALGKKSEAVSAYGTAVAARPDDPMLRAVYGGLLSESGKGKEAVVELKAAIASDDPALLASIASVLTKEKAFDACIQALEKAMAQKKVPALLVRRGICRDGNQDEKGAAADYEAALGMDAKFAPAHYYYAVHLAPKNKKKALEHAEKASNLSGDKGIGPDAKKLVAELRKK